MRDWISKNAPDADASSLKLGWYPSRYATGLGSILNLDDITSHIPSDKNDIVILEEPEHLNWYDLGVPLRCLHFNTTRVPLTSTRVVSFPILRPFGPGTATARAGPVVSGTSAASPTRIMKRTPSPTTSTRTARPKSILTSRPKGRCCGVLFTSRRRRRDSCPPDEAVGGLLFFDFEPVHHESVRAGSSRRRSLELIATWWSSCRGHCGRCRILGWKMSMG